MDDTSAANESLHWGAALTSGAIGLAGVLVGSALTLWGQRRERQYRHRERVRSAYAKWSASIDALTQLESDMLSRQLEMNRVRTLPGLAPKPREELMQRLDQDGQRLAMQVSSANHREAAAFGRLMFLDHGSVEIRLADEIRKLKPGHKVMMETKAEFVRDESFERFLDLEREQATKLGILAAMCCQRFGRPHK